MLLLDTLPYWKLREGTGGTSNSKMMRRSKVHTRLSSQGVSQPQGLPAWMYFLCGFGILIIVQGALRKWVFPDLATPLYITKDLVLLGGFGLFLDQYGLRLPTAAKRTSLPLLWGGLAIIVCLQAFNLRVPSPAVGLLGIRNYLLYSVLLVMIPMALQYVRHPRRLVTIVGLVIIAPVLVLGFYQYTMPVNHWINQYVAAGSPVNAIAGDPRITGPFSYIQGMGTFLVFSMAFGLAVFIAGTRRGNRWYQLLGAPLLGLALIVAPMNGSRSVVYGVVLAVPFVLYRALQRGRRAALFAAVSIMILAGGYVVNQSEWATQGWSTFGARVDRAPDQTRVESMLQDPFRKIDILLGYGAGSTHPGASALSSEGKVNPEGVVGYEEELGRVIIELGAFGGLLFFALKFWILWMTWDAMQRARNSWEDVISMTAFTVSFLHLFVEKIVFNHIGGSVYWLCAGAALWVWCRRDESFTDADSARVVSKRAT